MSTHPAQHPDPDRLLELAYGELSEAESATLNAHVTGCEACGRALEEIGGVRRVMAPLGEVRAPDSGLESLLAYAEQSAARAREEQAQPRSGSRWWRGLIPVVLTALLVVGGVLWSSADMFGSSAQALAGVDSAPRGRSVPGALAFGAPQEVSGQQTEAFAQDREADEGPPASPEKKQHVIGGVAGGAPARSAPPPPPSPPASVQRRARARTSSPAAEKRSESMPAPAASQTTEAHAGRDGGGDAAAAGRPAPVPEGEGGESFASDVGTREVEEAPLAVMREQQEGAPVATRKAERAASAPPAAAGRSGEAEQAAVGAWSVPTNHLDRLRERASLRAEVAADGRTLTLAEALGRLCRLEDALEEHAAADATCRRLLAVEQESVHADFARARARRRGDR